MSWGWNNWSSTGPNGCKVYWPQTVECFGHGTCIPATNGSIPAHCNCDSGWTGYSPIVNNNINGLDLSCQSHTLGLQCLRILPIINSFIVVVISLKKIYLIGPREMKKEIGASLGNVLSSKRNKAISSAKSKAGGASSTGTTVQNSEKNLSEKESEKGSKHSEAEGGKVTIKKIGSNIKKGKSEAPAEDPSINLPLTSQEKFKIWWTETKFIPRAFLRSVVVKILFIAQGRAWLNFVLLFSMVFATPTADLRGPVIWAWALGQLLFWGQQTLIIYRFMETNILSQLMKKSADGVPILIWMRRFYWVIYLLIIIAQIFFISIDFTPEDNENLMLTWFVWWSLFCGVHAGLQVSMAIYALHTTNGFLKKSLASASSKGEQREAVLGLKKKNDALLRICFVLGVPVSAVWLIMPFFPAMLRSIDFFIQILALFSAVFLQSGLRFFK